MKHFTSTLGIILRTRYERLGLTCLVIDLKLFKSKVLILEEQSHI